MMTAFLLLTLFGSDEKEADEAIARFKTAYRNPSAPARVAAVAELSRTRHEKVLKQLAVLLTGDAAIVRAEAAKGLGTFVDFKKHATPLLIAGLGGPNSKEPDVQAAIYEALGALDDDAALPTIHKGFEEKDSKVAKGALAAAGMIRHVSSIDLIVDLMKKLEKFNEASSGGGGLGNFGGGNDPNKKRAKEVLPACIKALQAITKEKWSTSKEWEIWWERRKATFKIEN